MKDAWFPKRHRIAEGVVLTDLRTSGAGWQIYGRQGGGLVLVAVSSLFEYWETVRLASKADFACLLFDDTLYFYLPSESGQALCPVDATHGFVSAVDGLAYAVALRETRKILRDKTLRNGLFVERLSRILPMPNEIEPVADEMLLGTWLTGGMGIAANSTRRMLQVQPLLDGEDLARILEEAGLPTHAEKAETAARDEEAPLPRTADTAGRTAHRQPFSLPGRKELETFLIDHVIDLVEHPDDYAAMKIGFPGAFILQGPPGCGKTYAVQRLVEYLDWPAYYIEAGSVGSPYIHETSKKISQIFREASEHAPAVLVIDEMESFLSTRSQSTEGNNHHTEEIAEFLRKIPEAAQQHVLLIGMTNMIDSIDPAIRRRGRFDHIIEVGMPSAAEIQQVLENQLAELPHDTAIDIPAIAAKLEGLPMSDVAFAIREAARLTAKNHLRQISCEIMGLTVQHVLDGKRDTSRPIGFHD